MAMDSGDVRLRDTDLVDGADELDRLPKHVALLIAACLSLALWIVIWDVLKYVSASILP